MEAQPVVNILVVDDKPGNLLAMEAALEGLGVNVVKAQSGEEALRQMLHQEFAVVILDISMSMGGGFETLKLIKAREQSRTTPVIFATATYNLDLIEDKAYALGALDLLAKPVKRNILRAKVSALVELFKEKHELKRTVDRLRQATSGADQA
jgi:CheY-like chemotaxis protein